MPEIRIRPYVNQHALHWLGGGALGVILLLSMLTQVAHTALYGLLLCALVALLLGCVKLLEPSFSFHITPHQIVYHHRYGNWQLPWDEIQRCDVVRVRAGWEHKELPFVGLRLRAPDAILESISLRLASRLLLEQQALLLYAQPESNSCDKEDKQSCSTGDCLLPEIDGLMEDDHFESPNGSCYSGLLAMLGRRMQRLHQGLGYDLYIPLNALDRPGSEFIGLLQACQANRHRYTPPAS